MKRAQYIIAAGLMVASVSACAGADPSSRPGDPSLAAIGHPHGYSYTPARLVKSGSCQVEISSPDSVAFGCPNENGTFVNYKPRHTETACEPFIAWARHLGGYANCSVSADGTLQGSTAFSLNGAEIEANFNDGLLHVTRIEN
jgi:hypothetical protein